MSALSAAVHYMLDLGPPVMMPGFITILGLFLGQGHARFGSPAEKEKRS
jgi:galactitol-specific phosphotransferase system IIC component